jgi:uncharacterized membrane protein
VSRRYAVSAEFLRVSNIRNAEPTYAPPVPEGLAPTLDRNIRSLWVRRRREEREAPWQVRLADTITRFTGSMTFVFLHLAVFGFWIVANLRWLPLVPAWDESFVVLAMVASVEAIFLSTFVLISQNRMAASAERRAELDLQISLLAEHEITKMANLLARLATQLGVSSTEELDDVKRDVAPDAVMDAIEEQLE